MTWYTVDELRNLSTPEYLIPGYLIRDTVAQLGGRSQVGKSFQEIDWACRVATEGGRAAIFAAEGVPGIPQRIDAWERHHGVEVPSKNLLVRTSTFQITVGAAVAEVRNEIRDKGQFDLICLDTWARYMVGANENDAKDTSIGLAHLDVLREAAGGATALLVTHFGWQGERQRGSSALYSACDTVVYMKALPRRAKLPETVEDEEGYYFEPEEKKSNRCRLIVEKQKDADPEDTPRVTLELTPVPDTGSCVLVPIVVAPKVAPTVEKAPRSW